MNRLDAIFFSEKRNATTERMIEVAGHQQSTLDKDGNSSEAPSRLPKARATLAKEIGDGVATSEQFIQCRSVAGPTFRGCGAGIGRHPEIGGGRNKIDASSQIK